MLCVFSGALASTIFCENDNCVVIIDLSSSSKSISGKGPYGSGESLSDILLEVSTRNSLVDCKFFGNEDRLFLVLLGGGILSLRSGVFKCSSKSEKGSVSPADMRRLEEAMLFVLFVVVDNKDD